MSLELAVVLLLALAVVGSFLHRRWSRSGFTRGAWWRAVAGFLVITILLALYLPLVPGDQGFLRYAIAIASTIVIGAALYQWLPGLLGRPDVQALAGHFLYSMAGIFIVFVSTLRYTGFIGREAPGPLGVITNPADPAQRAAILRHAATDLDWSDTAHAVQDRQFLDSVAGNQPVPTDIIGTIKPPMNAHLRENFDLAFGRGRIVHRITLTNVAGNPYPANGYHSKAADSVPGQPRKEIWFPPGVSYMWVDSLVMLNDTIGMARSFIIPEDTLRPVRRGPPVTYFYHEHKMPHPGYWWNRSLSRWSFKFGSGWTWGNCTTHGCCES